MSYIRPLSNPEGLYVIGTSNRQVQFLNPPDWEEKKRDIYLNLPRYIFHGLMLKFLDIRDNVRYRGAALTWLTQGDLGGPVMENGFRNIKEVTAFKHPDLYKWRLTFPSRWGADGVNAWEVTWTHIAHNIKGRR